MKYSNVQAVYRPGKDAEVVDHHSVVLVGYNNDHNPPYWVAKNSYGSGWGDGGFFKVWPGPLKFFMICALGQVPVHQP
jgi:cysteine peptidase B